MAVPAAVATQLTALNAAMTRLLQDRDRIGDVFDDGLGNSVYNLLSSSNQAVFKNAVVNDMGAARDAITSVINALAAM
jgi:hypothetical protein